MKTSEIIIYAWQKGRISEGQAARLLGVDRLTARTMRDDLQATQDNDLFCSEHQCPKNLVDYEDGSRYECPECQRDEIEMTEKERADRLEAMLDRTADTLSQVALLDHKLLELCWEIEKCGASEQLTKTVVMAGDIRAELREIVGGKAEIFINVQNCRRCRANPRVNH